MRKAYGVKPISHTERETCEPLRVQHGPVLILSRKGFEVKCTCWDPKDGELCLDRTKPEETSVEVRCGVDVQIARQSWV